MFVPRRIYGDYLSSLLTSCMQPIDARCKVTIETVDAQVIDISENDDQQATLHLDNGESFDADRIVLATGNPTAGIFSMRIVAQPR